MLQAGNAIRPPSKAVRGGSLWGQAEKPEKSASSQGLVLADERMTLRKLLAALEQEGQVQASSHRNLFHPGAGLGS